MADISKLKENEKIFLAGCMKTMMMADGVISASELKDVDNLREQENFTDFEACLEKFEEAVKNDDDFQELARAITSQNARDIILSHIYEVSLEDGVATEGERKFYNSLKDSWGA